MPQPVVARIRLAHCKRGPERCPECQAMDREAWSLLALYAPGEGEAQRRVMEVELEGLRTWRAFEVLRVFNDEEEARSAASAGGIPVLDR